MYDFEPTKAKPDTQLVAETQKEFKHLGRIKLKPGHSLFAFNTKTTHLKKVEIQEQVMIDVKGQKKETKRAYQEPDTIYVTALNARNALRKIINSFNQLKSNQT